VRAALSHGEPAISIGNKIEHRLFSFISSQNWLGRPLVSHEVIVNLTAATTTTTGLRVRSRLDTKAYPAGHKVTRDEIEAVKLRSDPNLGTLL